MSISIYAMGCMAASEADPQSYGITLAGVPTSRTTSGTGNRHVQVFFQGYNNNNVVVTATGASNASSNWNPNGHSRSLFQVRAVNTSGTAPSGSGTAWREANVSSDWSWSRTTAGTTSGAIRLEIRDKATGTILATRDFSASLTRTDTQINVNVGHNFWGDDKVVFPFWGYKSSSPSIGSVNPTTLSGANILGIVTSNLSGTNDPEIELRVILSGSRAKNFWTSLVINGVTFNSADASHGVEGGNTVWYYGLINENWPIKDDTPLFKGATVVPVTFT